MRSTYIDLDRRFIDCEDGADPEQAAMISALVHGRDKGPGWDDLLTHGRAVVLGEAGSGKTWEMEALAERLAAEGRAAFFVRVEALAHGDLALALGPGETARFQRWLRGKEPGVFLLDAKDEAQLSDHYAVERALKSFVAGLGPSALARAKTMISCRVSEWQTASDTLMVLRMLGPSPLAATKPPGENEGLEDDDPKRIPPVRVVQLAPLDSARVKRLATAHLGDAEPFVRAIDHAHAWDFARRPRDVENLLSYWRANGRLGALHQIIEHDVTCKLAETNDNRSRNDPLPSDKARRGAEALAAAVTLTRRFTFPVPEPSAVGPADSLDPRAVLANWREQDIRALLGRALFDEAAYGRIRFHHRGTLDYLAARWLLRLTEANCPQQVINRLLFREVYGHWVVVPSLAPVAAWLSAWLPAVRRHLMEIDPEIFLNHGDPSLIPLPERETLLRSLAEHLHYRADANSVQLARLADPSLAPTIIRLLRRPDVARDVKLVLLRIVREGRIAQCGRSCLVIAAGDGHNFHQRLYAIEALKAIGDPRHLRLLAKRLRTGLPLPSRLAAVACGALYPGTLDESGLAEVLGKAEMPENTVLSLPRELADMIEKEAPVERLPALITMLVALSRREPWVIKAGAQGPTEVSQKFRWVYEPLVAAVRRVLALPDLGGISAKKVASVIEHIARINEYLEVGRGRDRSFQDDLASHPKVRQELTWRGVERLRRHYPDEKIWAAMLESYWSQWSLGGRDIPWLLDLVRSAPERSDRRMAFKLAIQLRNWYDHSWSVRAAILGAAARNPELWDTYRREMTNPVTRVRARVLQRLARIRSDGMQLWWLRHRLYPWRNKAIVAWQVLTRFHWVWQGQNWWLLNNLRIIGEDEGKIRNRYEDWSPTGLTRRGCKLWWRHWNPPLLEDNFTTSYYPAIISLAGIKAAVDDGLDFGSLSPEEVEIAARLSLHELNGFPSWLTRLVAAHPQTVREVYRRQIAAEFAVSADHPSPSGLLSDLGWGDQDAACSLCTPDILDFLTRAQPDNIQILRQVLQVLARQREVAALTGLVARYTPASVTDESRLCLWLGMWFQLDAKTALDFLTTHLAANPGQADDGVTGLAASLGSDSYDFPHLPDPDYRRPAVLRRLIPILFRHIRPGDDIRHKGAYSPVARDHGQDFRNRTIALLAEAPGPDAHQALVELAADRVMNVWRDHLLHRAIVRAKRDAEVEPWSPSQMADFARSYEHAPATTDELFDLVLGRFEDIIEDAENGDFSPRGSFDASDHEEVLQKWLATTLDVARRGMYEVLREAEVAFDKLPDIRIVRTGLDPVTIEAKWAHKWSFTQLRLALEDQLVGQYMLTRRSRHGLLVLANLQPSRIWVPTGEPALDFRALCCRLQQDADTLVASRRKGDKVRVLGIELA